MVLFAVITEEDKDVTDCILFDSTKNAFDYITKEYYAYISLYDKDEIDDDETFAPDSDIIWEMHSGDYFNIKFKTGEEIKWTFISPRLYVKD